MASGARQRLRPTRLYPSDIMTIAILVQQSHYRTVKAFYTEHVQRHLRGEFPHLVSYTRLVELLPSVPVPLIVYLRTQLGACAGISVIDSAALSVCRTVSGWAPLWAVASVWHQSSGHGLRRRGNPGGRSPLRAWVAGLPCGG